MRPTDTAHHGWPGGFSAFDPAIRRERVLPEILLRSATAFCGKVFTDNLELVGIRAALLTHRPVAAIDDAVFAEALPAVVEDRLVVSRVARCVAIGPR